MTLVSKGSIRLVKLTDLEQVFRLFVRNKYPRQFTSLSDFSNYLYAREVYAHWVVLSGNNVVGYIQVKTPLENDANPTFVQNGFNVDDLIYIGKLLVDAEYRGQFFSQLLLQTAMFWIQLQGKTPVLDVHMSNFSARKLYDNFGFEEFLPVVDGYIPMAAVRQF